VVGAVAQPRRVSVEIAGSHFTRRRL